MSLIDSSAEDPRLIESEQRYRAVIQNASDMIQSVRPDGTFEFVNQAWHTRLGYTPDDLSRLTVWDIIHPDSIEHCMPIFVKAVAGEPIPYMETAFRTKDGDRVPVDGTVTSRFVGDTVVATHGFFRDISERLRAQELEARNVQLERDQRARYLEKMAALGKLSAGLAHELNNPAAAAQRAGSRLAESLTRRDAAMRELIRVGLSPDQWQAIESLFPDDPTSSATALSPLEISEQETDVEEWLEEHGVDQAWDIAPALVQAGIGLARLESFARQIPAPALTAAVQWHAEAQTVREIAAIISRSSHRISELVNAVKGYSYMDRATEQLVDIHEGLESTLIILGHRLRNVTIARSYDPNLPSIPVLGSSLNQVWTNILDNAIDATDGQGTIAIRTRREDDTVVVEFEDDGTGIAPDDLACIFEPFFTTKPQGQGTGLGLDTVWRIVTEELGGTVTVESEPGRTVFQVTLPLARSQGASEERP